MKLLCSTALVLLFGCGNQETTVKSPFSHLDTVKTTAKVKDEPKRDGSVKSPFSGLDKK